MSEANNPNNSPLEANSPPDGEEVTPEPNDSLSSEQPPEAQAEASKTSNTDWFTLTSKLRQRNRSLLKKVASLENALAESQEALQGQIRRAQNHETLFGQQAEDFKTTQEQLARLFYELESSHQTSQRQQILIETLSEQLEASQGRLQQIEQEYSRLQDNYQAQSQQLLQKEKQAQELRSRLHRQQQRALQFKAALDKCLEVPQISQAFKLTEKKETNSPEVGNQPEESLFPKAQPIQPWSTQQLGIEEETETVPEWLTESGSEEEPPREAEVLSFPRSSSEPEPEEETSPANAKEILEDSDSSEQELAREETEQEVFSSESLEDLVREVEDNPPTEEEGLLSPSNWPSPVVYPLRPHKKRTSFAAIELPNFPRHGPS